MKTAIFYTDGGDSLEVPSNKFRRIRNMASSGIGSIIQSGKKIYVAKNTLERIRAIL